MQVRAAHKLSPHNIFFDKKGINILTPINAQKDKKIIYSILHTHIHQVVLAIVIHLLHQAFVVFGRDAILPLDKTRDVNYSCRQQR